MFARLRPLVPYLKRYWKSLAWGGVAVILYNVIKVMQGLAEPETDGREGLKSLEVLIAAYKSARDGKRVALPLEY